MSSQAISARRLRFGLRSVFALVTLACGLSAGIAYLWFTPRPSDLLYRRLLAMEGRLAEFPTSLGGWKATGDHRLNVHREFAVLTFEQTYEHASSREELRLVLMAGGPKEAVRFTYVDGCDVAYETGSIEVPLDRSDRPAMLASWVTKPNPDVQMGYWAVSRDGNWLVPRSVRREFRHDDLVYRVFFVLQRQEAVEPEQLETETRALVQEFARLAIPELNAQLFEPAIE